MKLGVNLLQVSYWTRQRPFSNFMWQGDLPWSGDFGNRTYERNRYVSGETYKSLISAEKSMPAGVYTVATSPEIALTIVGAKPAGLDKWKIPVDGNVWIEFTVSKDLPVDQAYISITQDNSPAAGPLRPEFMQLVAPFNGVLRPMDWCGAFSARYKYQRLVSPTQRREPLQGVLEAFNFSDEQGLEGPAFTNLQCRNLWLNAPIVVGADVRALGNWLSQRMGWGKTWLAIGNELWNDSFPQARFMRQAAESNPVYADPFGHPEIPRLLMSLDLSLQAKKWLEPVGVPVIFEWQNAAPWMFEDVSWRDNERQREMLRQIGHVAVAPYFADNISSLAAIPQSITTTMADLRRWKAIADDLGIKLHVYECGQHIVDQPISWQTSPQLLSAIPTYLDAMDSILDSDAMACWYGLTSEWDPGGSWGLAEFEEDISNPKYQEVVKWKTRTGS